MAEPKEPLAFRVRPQTLERLRRRATEVGETQSALAQRYVEEGLRTDEHPLIYFRSGEMGRRPALLGTRLDVWQVVETVRANGGSAPAAADYLELPVERVEACLRYYADDADEIDAWIDRVRAISEREASVWRRRQELLG